MLGSGLAALKIVLGCIVDKIFLRARLVPMEHRAPLAPMDSYERHPWQLTVGWRPPREGGRGRGSWCPMTRGVASPMATGLVLSELERNPIHTADPGVLLQKWRARTPQIPLETIHDSRCP